MALETAIQDASHITQTITWKNTAGDPLPLTDATITGTIRNSAGVVRAIDGDLDLITAADGIFKWTYGTLDIGTAGIFMVQFIATYSTNNARSFLQQWTVEPKQVVA